MDGRTVHILRHSLLGLLAAGLLLGLVALPGRSADAPLLVPRTRPAVVVVLGSSTAEGAGAGRRAEAWVSLLAEHLRRHYPQVNLINLARSRYTSFQLLPQWDAQATKRQPDPERNISKALSLRPDLILINLPSNDNAAGIPLTVQMRNLRRIVSLAEGQGVPIYISTAQPLAAKGHLAPLQRALTDSVRQQFGPHVLDFWTGLALPNAKLKPGYASPDGLHLNDAGHQLLFRRVATTVPWHQLLM